MAKGNGPRNLANTVGDSTRRVASPRIRASRAQTPSVSPRRASAGVGGSPPAGAGSGIAKASSPMARPPGKKINRPKVGRPPNTRRAPKPRADFPSTI